MIQHYIRKCDYKFKNKNEQLKKSPEENTNQADLELQITDKLSFSLK